MKKYRHSVLALLVIAAVAVPAGAVSWTIQDGNNIAIIDDSSMAGNYSWTVNGNELYPGTTDLPGQWFWYRTTGMTQEKSVDTLPLTLSVASDTDGDGFNDTLVLTYTQAGAFEVFLKFSIVGSNVGAFTGDISEQIRITNLSTTDSLDFHLFEYVDFDLGGFLGDRITISGTPNPNEANQADLMGSLVVTETVIGGNVNRSEAELFNTTLNKLTDGNIDDLAYLAPALPPVNVGDATWAMQWDRVIAVGGDFSFSKDKRVELIPEPLTMLAVFGGVAAVGGYIRKRRTA